MASIEKDYFALDELEERWEVPQRDLAYLAENGLLKVSVRLYGAQLEHGSYEEIDEGQWCSIPESQAPFTGFRICAPMTPTGCFTRARCGSIVSRLRRIVTASCYDPRMES